ncbi:hypothetical protein MKZ38_008929 [Zalerion maritima]|uniref:Uncharacterized protein n=1 Tax=Zalerion maritima TaxID=339359 RepID=A0AAD5WNS7_9PEZI|nr:hypothetical protein MKZ38_008929 [Zalerion maritima]
MYSPRRHNHGSGDSDSPPPRPTRYPGQGTRESHFFNFRSRRARSNPPQSPGEADPTSNIAPNSAARRWAARSDPPGIPVKSHEQILGEGWGGSLRRFMDSYGISDTTRGHREAKELLDELQMRDAEDSAAGEQREALSRTRDLEEAEFDDGYRARRNTRWGAVPSADGGNVGASILEPRLCRENGLDRRHLVRVPYTSYAAGHPSSMIRGGNDRGYEREGRVVVDMEPGNNVVINLGSDDDVYDFDRLNIESDGEWEGVDRGQGWYY